MTMRTNRLRVPTPSVDGKDRRDRYIAYTEWGDKDNPHVVICVHGLTRNCRDFDFFAEAIQTDCRVLCVDVVGRGHSDWLEYAHDYENYQVYLSDAMALVSHIREQASGEIKLDWVGISLGGLIGMLLSIQPSLPIPVRKLVMSDIGPLIPAAAMSRMSEYVGKKLNFETFDEFEAYIKKISASFGPLTESQWHHLTRHSMRKFNDGTFSFRYDPKISISFKNDRLREDIDLWSFWDKLQADTLVLRGTESDVLFADTAAEMQKRGPKARIIELKGVGHAPVLLDAVQIAIVKDFLLP